MIRAISLSNFQSHKDTTLKFHKGVNILKGQSDSGKTSVLRALNWLINNKPVGEAFRSSWGGPTSVGVVLSDKTGIVRFKNKTNNSYSYTHDGMTDDYVSFNKGVPEEVTQALNILPVNIQSQLDPPYLLSASPGEVARSLNEVASLDAIDSSLSNVASRIRANANEQRDAERAIENMEEDLKAYEGLEELDGFLTGLEGIEGEWMALEQKALRLIDLLRCIKEIEDELKKQIEIDKAEESLEKLEGISDELGKVEQSVNELNLLGRNIRDEEDLLKERKEEVEELERRMPKVCPTCGGKLK